MQDLGSLGGTLAGCGCLNQQGGLNNRGEVVGLSNLPGDQTADPFPWDGEQLIDLFTSSAGGSPVTASATNDDGEVVGAAVFPKVPFVQAYLWKKGVAVSLATLPELHPLHFLCKQIGSVKSFMKGDERRKAGFEFGL